MQAEMMSRSQLIREVNRLTSRLQQLEAEQADWQNWLKWATLLTNMMLLVDKNTAKHQLSTAKLAYALAKRMEFSESDALCCRLAAEMHDVGKLYVPAQYLSRMGCLADVEFEVVKQHPLVGWKILKDINFDSRIAQAVLEHHERLNGKGYPEGKRDGRIIFMSKIIAVADVAAALCEDRPYRRAFDSARVLAHLSEKSGVLFDPDVVNACVQVFEGGFCFN
jgi:putative nucleotidyltransferase with HDIG domain